ncbi:MAG: glycoside hydrolase family 125 protein [Breznakibacter sp.]
MKRREFITKTGLATATLMASPLLLKGQRPAKFLSKRPPLSARKFTSKAVEAEIARVKSLIADPELAWMFENCYPNTLDTTVEFDMRNGMPDTFVITGDIHAMWLRDSTAQVWPYLPLTANDNDLRLLILGVINRQTWCIHIDPYANAFNKEGTGSEWENDLTAMNPYLHERKWEIDSLCYPVRLAHGYWKTTGDTSFFTPKFKQALDLIYQTFTEQQRKNGKGPYSFMRVTEKATDTVPMKGYGYPVRPNGLICSSFRPSDDATVYSFLIPSNFFAVETLNQMAEMHMKLGNDRASAQRCESLAKEVGDALAEHATFNHPKFGKIYAFETDGISNHLLMDDANVPSLLAMPYLGSLPASDKTYQNTRRFALSDANPWYFEGKAGKGIGGPHVGEDMVWPLSIIVQALTSSSKTEIAQCLSILKKTHAGTGFMHETFHKDDATVFTREWFAWANTLFGELIIHVSHRYPDLLKQTF